MLNVHYLVKISLPVQSESHQWIQYVNEYFKSALNKLDINWNFTTKFTPCIVSVYFRKNKHNYKGINISCKNPDYLFNAFSIHYKELLTQTTQK